MKYLMMFPMLTYDPVKNPKKPTKNIAEFFNNLGLEHLDPWVTVSIIGGAIRASVELRDDSVIRLINN